MSRITNKIFVLLDDKYKKKLLENKQKTKYLLKIIKIF